MSAYYNIPADINTMVCTTCGTIVFAWLAEVFECPTCGDFAYCETDEYEDTADTAVEAYHESACVAHKKKREMSLSDDGSL